MVKIIEPKDSSKLAIITECLINVLPSDVTDIKFCGVHKFKEQGTSSLMYSLVIKYISEGLTHKKELALRLYKEGFEERGFKEFNILRALKQRDYPVPTPYCFDKEKRKIGGAFMIMEKIVGKPVSYQINDEIGVQNIIDRMAEILAKIHELDPDCIQNSNILQEQFRLRQARLLKTLHFIKNRYMDFTGFCPPRQRRFISAVKQLEEVTPKKICPSLLHLDYEPNHVLLSNERLFVVDWGEASIGDPAFDVGWAFHKLRLGRDPFEMDLGAHFVKCYEKYAAKRLVNLQFWKDMAILELASWCRLLPSIGDNVLRNYGGVADLMFGNLFGCLPRWKHVHDLRKKMSSHHTSIWSKTKYLQDYAVRYFERDRYSQV